jgi:hypothetical protein
MTSRFRTPWRPVGIPDGVAVNDASRSEREFSFKARRLLMAISHRPSQKTSFVGPGRLQNILAF